MDSERSSRWFGSSSTKTLARPEDPSHAASDAIVTCQALVRHRRERASLKLAFDSQARTLGPAALRITAVARAAVV